MNGTHTRALTTVGSRIGLTFSCLGLAWALLTCQTLEPSANEGMRVVVVGDSVSAGVNSDSTARAPAPGWVAMFTERAGSDSLAPDFAFQSLFGPGAGLINLARSGSRVVDWMEPAWLERVVASRPDVLVVMLGANDLLEMAADGAWTDVERGILTERVERFFDLLRNRFPETRVLVIGYYDPFDGLSQRLPSWLGVPAGFSGWLEALNRILESGARGRGWWYLDLAIPFRGHGYSRELGEVGLEPPYVRLPLASWDIHPNTAGHRAIAEEVSQFLLRVLK